ncbi:MAG TPA: hypothetical protein VIL84_13715 [Devosiaceae bacterium]
MSGYLSNSDVTKLTNYANSGNRYAYYGLLASKGDAYAKLALGVVTQDTLSGYVANRYMEDVANSLGVSVGPSLSRQIGVNLMNADLITVTVH